MFFYSETDNAFTVSLAYCAVWDFKFGAMSFGYCALSLFRSTELLWLRCTPHYVALHAG